MIDYTTVWLFLTVVAAAAGFAIAWVIAGNARDRFEVRVIELEHAHAQALAQVEHVQALLKRRAASRSAAEFRQ